MCIDFCTFSVTVPLRPKNGNRQSTRPYKYKVIPIITAKCFLPRPNRRMLTKKVPSEAVAVPEEVVADAPPASVKISETATVAPVTKVDSPEKIDAVTQAVESLVEKVEKQDSKTASIAPVQAEKEKEEAKDQVSTSVPQAEPKAENQEIKDKTPTPQTEPKPENQEIKDKTPTPQTEPKPENQEIKDKTPKPQTESKAEIQETKIQTPTPQSESKAEVQETKTQTPPLQTKPKTKGKLQKPQPTSKAPNTQSTDPTPQPPPAPSQKKNLKPPRKSVTFAPMPSAPAPSSQSSLSPSSSASDDSYTDPPLPVMAPGYFGTRYARLPGEPDFASDSGDENGIVHGKEISDEAVRRAVRKRNGLASAGNGRFYPEMGAHFGRATRDTMGQSTTSRNTASPVGVEIKRNGEAKLPRYFPPADARQRNLSNISNHPAPPIFERRGMKGVGVGKAPMSSPKKTADGTPPVPPQTAKYDDDSDSDGDSAVDVGPFSASPPFTGFMPGISNARSPQPRSRASSTSEEDGNEGPIIVYRSKTDHSRTRRPDENEPIFVARPAPPAFASNKSKGARKGKSKVGGDFLMSGAMGGGGSAAAKGRVYQRPSIEDEDDEGDN